MVIGFHLHLQMHTLKGGIEMNIEKLNDLRWRIRNVEENIRSCLIDLNSFLVENFSPDKLPISVDDYEVGVDARGGYVKDSIHSCTYNILSSSLDDVLDIVCKIDWEEVIKQLEFRMELQLDLKEEQFGKLSALVYALHNHEKLTAYTD